MADAGSSGLQSSVNGAATRSDFSFPDQDGSQLQPQHRSTRPERTVAMNTLGLGYPAASRRPSSGGRISSLDNNSSRRRVRSMPGDEDVLHPGPSRLRQIHDMEIEPHKRVASLTRRGTGKQRTAITSLGNMESHAEYSSTSFSDEYDLSHEDPRIIEDVQRALHLKARREARLKVLQGKKQPPDIIVPSDQGSISSLSSRASPARAKASEPLPVLMPGAQARSGSVESEVDFSPSIGAAPNHPVPSSCDNGATLDWTASSSDDERDRRWPLLAKRRAKEKGSANRAVVENQESLYTEKLAQIKARVKPHTLRKAAITGEQLQRRYLVLLDSTQPINLLSTARWYNKQDPLVRTALDNAQPLTWLKHLMDKRATPGSIRLPWHLTALIIEEFAKSLHPSLQSIPEDREVTDRVTPGTSSLGNSASSPSKASSGLGGSRNSWSWVASQTLEPSLSRKRPDTSEEIVSFEPQVDSGRSSAGGDSRRSSYDFMHGRKQSLTHISVDSPGSSLRNSSAGNYGSGNRMREFANRIRRKQYERSEEALSSGRNSISEQSHGEELSSPSKRRKRPRPSSLQSPVAANGISSDADEDAARDESTHSDADGSRTARDPTGSTHFGEQTITGREPEDNSPPPNTPAPPAAKPRPIKRLRGRRQSLPSLDRLLLHEQAKQQQQATEEQERREYQHRLQMLEDAVDQNRRTRQLLQRVGAQIREYENVQSRLSDLLGRPYISVPIEVLDALSHDPASVIGATRRYRSWRAVEDIHERIRMQRQTLRGFTSTLANTDGSNCDDENSAFREILASLSDSLEQLHGHRLRLAGDAEEVAEALSEVKDSHAAVKREYNEVMAHTSLIYPEISQIVALEENYRNRYQQIWDIGLDALTLLLDTVTPVWRNYGKVIGEDVQDFLIIPWYRNEFTGEKQRYPIEHLPRRSFRHWIGLLFFLFISVGVLVLQTGAALSSTAYYNLPWITNQGFRWLIIPFFIVGLFIQWTSVVVEFCIILAQIGVIMWWVGWAVRLCH